MNRREFGAAMLGAAVAGGMPRAVRGAQQPARRVNGARLNAQLAALARIGRTA